MIKTIGVCGYISTGSSAFVDLLHEFDETQVLDLEFKISDKEEVYGLQSLESHLKKYGSSSKSMFSLKFFEKTVKRFISVNSIDEEAKKVVDDFLKKINPKSSGKLSFEILYACYRVAMFTKSVIVRFSPGLVKDIREKVYTNSSQNIITNILDVRGMNYYSEEKESNTASPAVFLGYNITQEEFESATKCFIIEFLNVLNIDYHNKEKDVIVLNQPFLGRDPVRSFKYFENPKAIIVDRDPRDLFLFYKYFLHPKGILNFSGNVDDFINNFRIRRQTSQDLRKRDDIIFINFEELVYDCENTANKIADFAGITQRSRKGEFFKPTHSRNNTQLFKKYTDCKSELKKIEWELSEYIFPFENYPDIESEGEMFYGSQINKNKCDPFVG